MTQFKKCKIVMLPLQKQRTTPEEVIGKRIEPSTKHPYGELVYGFALSTFIFELNQLYILSDEVYTSHKNGDWVYEPDNHLPVYQFTYDIEDYPLHRVIATTDPSLELARPSDSFIKKYCELGGIDEVMVEYEFDSNAHRENPGWHNQKLKIAPDNTITIRAIKDSWNREEVIKLLTRLIEEVNENEELQNHYSGEYRALNKWIEENL